MKPKKNYVPGPLDKCQTPPYGIVPLLPYLNPNWIVWEPASGEGHLVRALSPYVRKIITSDLGTGQDFFKWLPEQFDVIITNEPFSLKYAWLKRCYELEKPFAVLLPVESIGAKQGQHLIKTYGAELMLLDQRIDFKMPEKGWNSHAQFPTMWWGSEFFGRTITCGNFKGTKEAFAQFVKDEPMANSLPSVDQLLMQVWNNTDDK